MIFALNHLLILVITPLLFHYRDVFLSVPVLGKISLGSQWISWSSDTVFIFCFKMTDERRQTLKQSGSQTARCLVRIMFANLKKGMKNKKKLSASSIWDRNRKLCEFKLCHLSHHGHVCATCPSSSTLFFHFFSFRPHGLLLSPILL